MSQLVKYISHFVSNEAKRQISYESNKKTTQFNFFEKTKISYPCLFRKFGLICFLVTSICLFALLPKICTAFFVFVFDTLEAKQDINISKSFDILHHTSFDVLSTSCHQLRSFLPKDSESTIVPQHFENVSHVQCRFLIISKEK